MFCEVDSTKGRWICKPASLSAGLKNGPKRMAKLRIYWQKSNKLFDWLLGGLEGSFADGMG
jgi:hypothetical protein